MKKIMLYIVLAMILIPTAFAIGISPAKKTFDLDYENGVAEAKIRVINNMHKEIRVLIKATGHLSEYVHFSRTDFIMGPEQSEDHVGYSLNISDIPLADMRKTKISIYVIEMPSGLSFRGSGASATTAAIHKLVLGFPFESPVRTEKEEEQAESQEGDVQTGGSTDTDYVPMEDFEEEPEESATEELEQKKPINAFVYVVIALIGLNLIWIVSLFRRKDKKKP